MNLWKALRSTGMPASELRGHITQAVSHLVSSSGYVVVERSRPQVTYLILLGLVYEQGDRASDFDQTACHVLLSGLSEGILTYLGYEQRELRLLMTGGIHSLVEQSVNNGDFAWLPLLLWPTLDIAGFISRVSRPLSHERVGTPPNAHLFLEQALATLDPLIAHPERWFRALDVILASAPTKANGLMLLLRAFSLASIQESRDHCLPTRLARHFSLEQLVGFVESEKGGMQRSLLLLLREAFIERATREKMDFAITLSAIQV